MTTAVVAGPLAWQNSAACRGMNRSLFFPEFAWMVPPTVLEACGHCPVREACLQWALEHDEVGVWGGLTEEQRAAIGRTRSRVRCIDCRSDRIYDDGACETCLSCGLSWRV